MLQRARSLVHSPKLWLLFLIVGAAAAVNTTGGPPQRGRSMPQDAEERLLREGMTIQSPAATCRYNGDRLTVDLEGNGYPLIVLENLLAQRIADALQIDPTDNAWRIEGEVTEFGGRNYVLLRLVQRANPRAPRNSP
ncbi:MAG: hypothetical protein D6753_13235 [Planctomycetota bacterium]|nr:MAG: hypothetical protein D6753_13235 [Planctomycetota bacterium]